MMDRPFSSNVDGGSDRGANGGFTLLALHSADRMTRSLSPWTRLMLGDEPGIGTARHTVLSRVLRRRTQGSSSFPSTLSILRRFHRIVTRSTAWKVGVGSVDPNLFDRFATDLVKRQQIGANNIPSLISLGEQRRREMDMPLAGAIGEIAPGTGSDSISASSMASQMGFSAPTPAASPAPADNKPLTMEEIKRRIEEAKRFKSNTPGSVPDFVRAGQQPKPGAAPTPPGAPSFPPGFPPMPNQPMSELLQRVQMPPSTPTPRPPDAANLQPGEPNVPSQSEQRVPPRLRRRRFASVEYVSLPNMEDEDSSDKDEPASPWRFATGPPGDLAEQLTQWIEPFSALDTPIRTASRTQRRGRPQTVAPIRTASSLAAPRPIRAMVRPEHRVDRASVDRAKIARRRGKSASFLISSGERLTQTDSAIARRPLLRLADTLSGQTLVSRPHNLMAQVLRKEDVAPPEVSGDAPVDRISFVPSARPPMNLDEIRLQSDRRGRPSLQRAEDRRLRLPASRWLAISPDDFVLTPPRHARRRRHDPADEAIHEDAGLPVALPPQPQSLRSPQPLQHRSQAQPQALSGARRPQPATALTAQPVPTSTGQRSRPRVQRRGSVARQAIRRAEDGGRSLAQLQVTPSTRPLIFTRQEPLALSAVRLDRLPAPGAVFAPLAAPVVQRSTSPATPAPTRPQPGERERRKPASQLSVSTLPVPPFTDDADFVARRVVESTSRQVSRHTRAMVDRSPINRSFQHLAGALSGQILASRPQTLMAQILAPETKERRGQPAATPLAQRASSLRAPLTTPAALTPSLVEIPSFVAPADRSGGTDVPQRLRRVASAQRLPISVDDFVLSPARRPLRVQDHPDHLVDAPQQDVSEVSAATPPPDRSGQRPISSPPGNQPSARRLVAHRRPLPPSQGRGPIQSGTQRPVLAQLQAASLNRSIATEKRTLRSSAAPLAPVSASQFEPVSALWRQSQFAQPEAAPTLRQPPAFLVGDDSTPMVPPVLASTADLGQRSPFRPTAQRQQTIQRTVAQVIPLELAMRRQFGSRATPAVEDAAPAVPQVMGRVMPAVARSTQPGSGDRGSGIGNRELKIARTDPLSPVPSRQSPIPDPLVIRRSVERPVREWEGTPSASRPQPSPTLMERVLSRDFAGVRVQTASLPSTEMDAIVWRPQAVGGMARSLAPQSPDRGPLSPQRRVEQTPSLPLSPRSVYRRFTPPMLQRQMENTQPTPLLIPPQTMPSRSIPSLSSPSTVGRRIAPPLSPLLPTRSRASVGGLRFASSTSSPLRPHLTRQLSQRLVQMSLAKEEPTAAAVEASVVRLASSAFAAQRFAPSSNAWRPQPAAPSAAGLPVQDTLRPASGVESTDAPRAALRRGPIQRTSPRVAEANWTQPERFDADTVRSLLEPGTLSIETLSDSSLLQRSDTGMRSLPLTDFVLARVDGGQRVRASQPALRARPLESLAVPFSPLRPLQPYPGEQAPRRQVQRRESAPAAEEQSTAARPESRPAQRRTAPQRTSRPVKAAATRQDERRSAADLRQAVQFMADKPRRYEGVEPVSRLWRSRMLSTPALVEQPSIPVPAPSAVERVRPPRLSSSTGEPPRQQIVARPVARPRGESQALPLAPTIRRADVPVRRTGIQVVEPERVAEAAITLPQRRRAERTLHLQAERVRPAGSPVMPGGEPLETAGVEGSSSLRTVRLIRRSVASDLPRTTLLERVAARDFADLRREQLAEGPLSLLSDRMLAAPPPSSAFLASVEAGAALTIPTVGAARTRVEPSLSPRQLSKELVQRSGLSDYPNLGSPSPRLQPLGTDFDPVSMAWPRLDWRQPQDDQPLDSWLPSLVGGVGPQIVRHAAAQVLPLDLAMRRLLGSGEIADLTDAPAISGDALRTVPSIPQVVGRVSPPVSVAPMVARMEERGWRFKRAERAPRAEVAQVRRSVESLGRERSRPLARPVRTLMERVLGRDFAGVRIQAASMAPLGVEAATRGDTVYLSSETARLDRPQSLGVLAHELTHVAARARQAGPMVQRQTTPLMLSPRRTYATFGLPATQDQTEISRARGPVSTGISTGISTPAAVPDASQTRGRPAIASPLARAEQSAGGDVQVRLRRASRQPGRQVVSRRLAAPTPSPLRPHLTRQLSQRLVQMSLAQEERTAEEVEAAVVRLASSAGVARRFAPASHLWRSPIFEESPTVAVAEAMDWSHVTSPLSVEQAPAPSISTGRGRVSRLPSLDLAAPIAPPMQGPQDRFTESAAPEFLPRRQDPSISAVDRPSSSVAQRAPSSAPLVQPERTVAALEQSGWRFKRAERPRLAAPDRVQRAVAQLQQRADRGMPLPRQPRTLMERVLQRDFSKVRVQTAPLDVLGVEAAARENTVYLAREQASRLDRPENLALLGHELTHVAASGNAPVQRRSTQGRSTQGRATSPGDLPTVQRRTEDGSTVQGTVSPQPAAMPLRPLLPATIQRSLAGEESIAAGVEQGLRTFLRQSSPNVDAVSQPDSATPSRSALPVVQRTPLAARPTGSPERVQRLTAVDENDAVLPRSGVSPVQLKNFRGGEPTLSGVPSVSMDVAPRTPIIRRMATPEAEQSIQRKEAPKPEKSGDLPPAPLAVQPKLASVIQRTEDKKVSDEESPGKGNSRRDPDAYGGEQETDWDHLAEKVYPFIRRMLLLERERRPR